MKKRLGLVLVMIFVLMITGCGNSNNTKEANVADNQIMENADQKYAEENISTENTLEELEIVSNEVDENIINVNEINAQGGNIEFADTMTYKEFLALQWTNDVDNSLANDKLVYVVKIYYPNGFEHYKVETINNCEAIGIYRADNGEYLGGSFRERLE